MTQETESEGDTGRPWVNHVVTGNLTTNTSTFRPAVTYTATRNTFTDCTVQTAASNISAAQTATSNISTVQTATSNTSTVQTATSNTSTVQTATSNTSTVQTATSNISTVQTATSNISTAETAANSDTLTQGIQSVVTGQSKSAFTFFFSLKGFFFLQEQFGCDSHSHLEWGYCDIQNNQGH